MQSHIPKVHACITVTCHFALFGRMTRIFFMCYCGNMGGWNQYQNKSQHRKLTLEKKLLQLHSPWYNRTGWLGVKRQVTYSCHSCRDSNATFQSWVWRSNHWAVPAAQVPTVEKPELINVLPSLTYFQRKNTFVSPPPPLPPIFTVVNTGEGWQTNIKVALYCPSFFSLSLSVTFFHWVLSELDSFLLLSCGQNSQKGSKECLFIRTQIHSLQIFWVIAFVRSQNNTLTIKWWKTMKNEPFMCLDLALEC